MVMTARSVSDFRFNVIVVLACHFLRVDTKSDARKVFKRNLNNLSLGRCCVVIEIPLARLLINARSVNCLI